MYFNHVTTMGIDGDLYTGLFGKGKHSLCREQIYYHLEAFAHLLNSNNEHLCAFLSAQIYNNLCGCDSCKEMYLKYIDRKEDYDRWIAAQEGVEG